MKPTAQDKELARLLKQESYTAEENQWFTARVVNRLPAKHSRTASVMATLMFVVAAIACVAFWVWLTREQGRSGVLTVRHLVYFAAIALTSIWTILTQIVAIMRRE